MDAKLHEKWKSDLIYILVDALGEQLTGEAKTELSAFHDQVEAEPTLPPETRARWTRLLAEARTALVAGYGGIGPASDLLWTIHRDLEQMGT
jgi:hypothetical protein